MIRIGTAVAVLVTSRIAQSRIVRLVLSNAQRIACNWDRPRERAGRGGGGLEGGVTGFAVLGKARWTAVRVCRMGTRWDVVNAAVSGGGGRGLC